MKTIVGTSIFVSRAAANKYYAEYGYSPEQVGRKLDEKEISIGSPEDTAGAYYTLDTSEGRFLKHSVITRKQYMDDTTELHHEYFLQFATKRTYEIVRKHIGVKDILKSTDKNMNDIALSRWDLINDLVRSSINTRAKRCSNEYNDITKWYWSVSDGTCIAKAVAREIRKEEIAKVQGPRLNKAVKRTIWGSDIVLPAATPLILIKGASGTKGDLYAVRDVSLLIELTGNAHDPNYRYCFVDDEDVTI
jgi:hypothetical protein